MTFANPCGKLSSNTPYVNASWKNLVTPGKWKIIFKISHWCRISLPHGFWWCNHPARTAKIIFPLVSEERLTLLECEFENIKSLGLSEVRRHGEQLITLKSGRSSYYVRDPKNLWEGSVFQYTSHTKQAMYPWRKFLWSTHVLWRHYCCSFREVDTSSWNTNFEWQSNMKLEAKEWFSLVLRNVKSKTCSKTIFQCA